MKHYFFSILLCLLTIPLFSFGQKAPIITFENKACDFGTVKYRPKSVIKIKFYYTNTGNAPLVIYKVDSSCECTVPNWTKKPIIPGKKDYILLTFKMNGKRGIVQKSIFVNTNTDEKVTVLHIKGEIIS